MVLMLWFYISGLVLLTGAERTPKSNMLALGKRPGERCLARNADGPPRCAPGSSESARAVRRCGFGAAGSAPPHSARRSPNRVSRFLPPRRQALRTGYQCGGRRCADVEALKALRNTNRRVVYCPPFQEEPYAQDISACFTCVMALAMTVAAQQGALQTAATTLGVANIKTL